VGEEDPERGAVDLKSGGRYVPKRAAPSAIPSRQHRDALKAAARFHLAGSPRRDRDACAGHEQPTSSADRRCFWSAIVAPMGLGHRRDSGDRRRDEPRSSSSRDLCAHMRARALSGHTWRFSGALRRDKLSARGWNDAIARGKGSSPGDRSTVDEGGQTQCIRRIWRFIPARLRRRSRAKPAPEMTEPRAQTHHHREVPRRHWRRSSPGYGSPLAGRASRPSKDRRPGPKPAGAGRERRGA
jgi:hypothetical protein